MVLKEWHICKFALMALTVPDLLCTWHAHAKIVIKLEIKPIIVVDWHIKSFDGEVFSIGRMV